MINRLFVYGTLRPGSSNSQAEWLEKNTCRIGSARMPGRLFRVSHYPALGPPQSTDEWVAGDLLEGLTIDMFKRLDEFEGAEYRRELAGVTLPTEGTVAAFVYVYVAPLDGLEWIACGDWKDFIARPFAPGSQIGGAQTRHS